MLAVMIISLLYENFEENPVKTSYRELADVFNARKNQVRKACVILEKLGLITREFKKYVEFNRVWNNGLFITIHKNKVKELIDNPREILKLSPQEPECTVLQGYVYLIKADIPKYAYKIGISAQPEKRAESFYTVKMPFETKLIHSIPCDDMLSFEGVLHSRYNDKRGPGEWFDLSNKDVAYICSIKKVGVGTFGVSGGGRLTIYNEIKEDNNV
jgi:DNA-binding Lrp family transcriptional regulator